MKFVSPAALAVLAAASGAAMAQSSVTLFGVVDAAYGRVSANGTSVKGISNSGINSSRLGFRGTEDLGGGLSAGFWIEGQLNNDVGQGADGATGLNFRRRSTVSLSGAFGEVRIGRDYSPSFWNLTVFDPFGTNGVGQSLTPGMLGTANSNGFTVANNSSSAVRSSNSIGYFLPGNLGGFYGQAQIGFGENSTGAKTGDYYGVRLGFANGPINVAGAIGKTKGATSAADTKYANIGGSYNFGIVTPMLLWAEEKNGDGDKIRAWEMGTTVAVGAGEIRAAYSMYDVAESGVKNDVDKFALGYVHNLSKRTALYTTYARVRNKHALGTVSVSNNGLGGFAAAPGGSSNGYEFGMRHSF